MRSLQNLILLASLLGITNAADTSGCGKQPTGKAGATTSFNITSSDTTRNFLVHVPSNYDNNHKYPVVLAFHGNTETAQEMELDTRLSDPKWSSDKIVVYPNGVNASWAGARYANTTIDEDLKFVGDVLVNLRTKFCVDSNKVYATGFSNGGGFVDILACAGDSVGKDFAAFVAASGAYYQEYLYNSTYECKPAKLPTPITFIHGKNDTDVFYDGGDGEGGFLPAVSSVVDKWVTRNRCTHLTTTNSDNGTVHFSSWNCENVDGAVQHYREDDMGHVWASKDQTLSQAFIHEGPTKIEANEIIMKFFDRFELDKEEAVSSSASASASFTASSSVLLPVTQATGMGMVGSATGSRGASPTATGKSGAGRVEGGVRMVAGMVGAAVLAVL